MKSDGATVYYVAAWALEDQGGAYFDFGERLVHEVQTDLVLA